MTHDILKEIFDGFAEASRIGMRIQIAADAAMRAEREEAEKLLAKCDEEDDGEAMLEGLAHGVDAYNEARGMDTTKPWNDDLNPQ